MLKLIVVPTPEAQGELTYFMYFPWPPMKATPSFFNFRFLFKKQCFEKELIKLKETVLTAKSLGF
jgi:hypothetical protein